MIARSVQCLHVLGAGHFGQRAALHLKQKHPKAQMVLVDQDPHVLHAVPGQYTRRICMDAVRYVCRCIKQPAADEWIVPAVPIHLAYEWLKARLEQVFIIEAIAFPQALVAQLPHAINDGTGKFYVSLADFKCPENCSEPREYCTYTRAPRPFELHRHLATLCAPGVISVVLQSRQLASGVGGYTAGSLFEILEQIATVTETVLFSTACRCHGVVQALRLKPRRH